MPNPFSINRIVSLRSKGTAWLGAAIRWGTSPSSLRRGSIKKRLLIALAVVLALVVVAPTLLLHTPLRSGVLARLLPAEIGSVTVESLSAGWFSPISATKVVIFDPRGERVAEVERVSIDRSLSALIANSRNLGLIRIEQPTVHAVVRADGSNLEDMLAAAAEYAAKQEEDGSTSSGITYRLEVVGGRILSRHVSASETWEINSVAASIFHAPSGQVQVQVAGEVPHTIAQGGPVGAGRFELSSSEAQAGSLTLRLACDKLPLAVANPWLKRFVPSWQVAGLATGETSVILPTLQNPSPVWTDGLNGTTSARMSTSVFRLTAPTLFSEPIALTQADVAWRVDAAGGKLTIESLSLASDFVMFDVRGRLPATAVARLAESIGSPLVALTSGDLDAEGRINIARMSQMLPGLLQIRPDTTITQGELKFTASCKPYNGGQQILTSIVTTPLAGVSAGRPIAWDAPLTIDMTAYRFGENLRLDQITCTSEFLEMVARGDPRQMRVEGKFNLDQLTRRLNQFVDLSDWQLAGSGDGVATWQTDTQGRLTAGGSGNLRDLTVVYQGDELAREPQLAWQATVLGNTSGESLRPVRLSSGQLSLTAGNDELIVDLVEAVDIASEWAATDWPLKLSTNGELASWARRLRPWMNLSDYQLAGNLDLKAKGRVRITPLRVALAESQLGLIDFRADVSGWKLNEGRVEWSGDLGWDQLTGTLTSREGRLVSSTVAATLRDWFWTADMKQAQQVGGLAAIRVNLERLAAVRPLDPLEVGRIDPTGELVGNVKLASHAGQVMAMIDLTANQVALRQLTAGLPGTPPTPQVFWQEPSLSLKGTVGYHPSDDRLTFDGLRGQSQTLAAAAGGSIAKLSTTRDLNVAGTIDYDLARLTPILAKYVGEGVKLVGREQAHFELSGSLSPVTGTAIQPVSSSPTVNHWASQWRGRVLAPWQSMTLYGLPVGPGRIAAQMGDGRVAIEPLAFTVADGQFSASPQVSLTPPPGEITLPAGPLLTSVQLTPEVSNEMLKYFVPYLAGATRTNGQFSIRLDSGRVPLGNPRRATLAGQLNLHSVKVGPGPEISRLLGIGLDLEKMLTKGGIASLLGATPQQPVTLLSITDRRIDFWVEQERVYHQGIEFGSDDLVFRSRGSVGFDQTVSVKIEIPIQEKWVRGSPLFHPLVGKSIELPVGGTLTKLEWDKGALLQELKRLGFSGADGGVIGNEINNALDKLLGGRRPQ